MNQFFIKPRVQFGANALDYLSQVNAQHAFIVTDKAMVKFGLADEVIRRLTQQGISFSLYDDVVPDPEISSIVKGMKIMDSQYPDLVIALGGGSVIDAAKAVIYPYGIPAKTVIEPNLILWQSPQPVERVLKSRLFGD